MKILIIDDSEYKIESLRDMLTSWGLASELQVAKSFHTAAAKLRDFQPDLVLLDMSLPTSERADGQLEGSPRIYGGKHILGEMELYNIQAKVIVITQFDTFGEPPHSLTLDTLFAQLKQRFPRHYVGGIYYSNVDSSWKEKLKKALKQLYPNIACIS